jgi:hypothetical protein
MNGSELHNHALDEMHHRLRQVRSYSLLNRDGSETIVDAALITKGDGLTESKDQMRGARTRRALLS